jgi:hypothetical protein
LRFSLSFSDRSPSSELRLPVFPGIFFARPWVVFCVLDSLLQLLLLLLLETGGRRASRDLPTSAAVC